MRVTVRDLGAQFFCTSEDVGKLRTSAVVDKLAELNRNVQVAVLEEELDEALIKSGRFQVVVMTETVHARQIQVDAWCRLYNVGFISADVKGVMGCVFVDLGSEFVVHDATGEAPVSKLIASVTNDKAGIVTCLEDTRHGLETGDHVVFEEVEGMVQLNGGQSRPIKVVGPYSFSIEDTTHYSNYTGGGRFRQVKLDQTICFQSLVHQLGNPDFLISPDMSKFDHPAQLHCYYQALSLFQSEFGHDPRPDVNSDIHSVLDLTKKVASSSKLNPEIKDSLILSLARGASAVIAPMAAALGGIVGQEVMKAVSGKFMPIRQFLYFDVVECLPENLPAEEYKQTGSRYDDYIAVFGKTIQQQVEKLSFFLVGAGAIGCEMLKNWALMGLGTSNASVVVTDMDTIEKSNLSRQFLFRNSDVGQLKSTTAAAAVKKMNPDFNVIAHSNRVAPETQNVYNDDFWESLDGVCTALDNVQARLYVDQRCVYYQKPMFESGTLGAKGNTQIVIPFLTESYGSTRDAPEQSFPVCTLKNFPYQIEHTIQWARDVFEGWFAQSCIEANNYIQDPNYLPELAKQPNSQLDSLVTVRAYLVDEKPVSFDDCIAWARFKFEEEFVNKIYQLLHNFPADSINSQGVKFWSGAKRCPLPLKFDVSDPAVLDFIIASANLHAFNYGIPGTKDVSYVYRVLEKVVVPTFQPKKGIKIAADDTDLKKNEEESKDSNDLEPQIKEILNMLPPPASLKGYALKPVDFEKDDDTNFHMDFITACSNLRARNYRIKEENRHETKLIAGKIIPAIATTTGLVAGLICLEIYKYVQKKKLEAYRSCFMTLAVDVYSFSEPQPPPKKKIQLKSGEWEWSLWDRFDLDTNRGTMTLEEFMESFKEQYGLTINMLSYGPAIIFSLFGNKKNIAERLKLPLPQVCANVSKTELPDSKYIILEACVNDDDDNDIEIPYLRVKIA